MIKQLSNYLKADTKNSSFIISMEGMPKLCYYGKKVGDSTDYAFTGINNPRTFTSADDVDNAPYLISTVGDGHLRENAVQIVTENGVSTLRLKFKGVKVLDKKPVLSGLPSAYGENACMVLTYADDILNIELQQYFAVYENSDVISTAIRLINKSDAQIRIKRLCSLQLDLPNGEYEMLTLEGASCRERIPTVKTINGGAYVNASFSGLSSNTRNPFVSLTKKGANGFCVQSNLIYSGNHKEIVEVSNFGGVRLLSGINDYLLDYPVQPNQSFDTPEAVFTIATDVATASKNMRGFVDAHVMPKNLRRKQRPIVVNTWETFLFNFDFDKLMGLCDKAKDLGVEMLVLDDGWFGKRNDDHSSLGDWDENQKKLGCSLKQFGEKIREKGLKFGIWVEPEMISRDSELYRAHPDWAMTIDGVSPLEIRYQLVLDTTKKEVRDYIVDKICAVIENSGVEYVKWDCNRSIQDIKNSGTVFHNFTLGLYDMLKRITDKFPDVIIESCASGGNRFDLGMLCYTPQIWCSDNVDARYRTEIQEGTLFAYPQIAMGTHVGHIPDWHTFNGTSYDNAFAVAMLGAFGYEFNLTELDKEQTEVIRAQVEFYKKWRSVLQFGVLTVNEYLSERGISSYTVADENKERAVATVIVTKTRYNYDYPKVYIKGLNPEFRYKVSFRKQAEFEEDYSFIADGSALEFMGVALGEMFNDVAVKTNYNSVQARVLTFEKI